MTRTSGSVTRARVSADAVRDLLPDAAVAARALGVGLRTVQRWRARGMDDWTRRAIVALLGEALDDAGEGRPSYTRLQNSAS